jgi:hypothetical protein
MSDARSSSLSHTLDVGVLLLVLGALLTGAMLLEATWTVARWQMEGESPEPVKPQLLVALGGAAMFTGGVIMLLRRRCDFRLGAWNHRWMDRADLELRNHTYQFFVERGRAPTAEEVADVAGSTTTEVEARWRRLHDQHALVLDLDTKQLRMANPFSAAPTPHRVRALDRWWYANCAWDAFGICAALRAGGRIETSCPDCGDTIAVEVQDESPSDESLVFHCLVPAEKWWDDIVFT